SARSSTTIFRVRDFATRLCFSDGGPTRNRAIAVTTSWRPSRLSSARKSSGRPIAADAPPVVRRLVRIERLLFGPQWRWDVLKVHSNARPRAKPAAHGVHEHIGRFEMCGRLGMAEPPTLEAGERVLLFRGASDFDQRVFRGTPAGRLHPSRLARLLLVLRRPRRIAESLTFVARRQLEQPGKRADARVDACMTIANFGKTLRHGRQREITRLGCVELVPRHRSRHTRLGRGPHRIRSGDGSVLGVLVVVEEYAQTFLFPPFARRQVRRPPLDLARQRKSATPHLVERPLPLDAHGDMTASYPRCLG